MAVYTIIPSTRQYYFYLFLIGLLVAVWAQTPEDINVLMVGNSYIIANSMNNMVRRMLQEGLRINNDDNDDNDKVSVPRSAHGGMHFTQHAERFESYLSRKPHWNWIILQEQSQVPGFWESARYMYEPSLQAVREMDDLIKAYNDNGSVADTVLLMTWGRRSGDRRNRYFYPDYLTMQSLLTEGYYQYRDAISTNERPVKIAPAGLAFEMVYYETLLELEQAQRDGDGAGDDVLNPAASGTKFSLLYSDGSHPSVRGSYLAALICFSTLTGMDPRLLDWAPSALDDEWKGYLQRIAAETMINYEQEGEQEEDQDQEEEEPQDVCAEEINIMWFGNSYSTDNDLVNKLRNMLEDENPDACFYFEMHTPSGSQLALTLPLIDEYLEGRPHWNYLILQEQSQIPGFYGGISHYYDSSLDAVRQLNNRLHDYNAAQGGPEPRTVLMMTWGRRDGDERNLYYYPDYQTMQDRITEGYEQYLDVTIDEFRPAIMAPVGRAFDMIYDDVSIQQEQNREQVDPSIRDGNLFSALYKENGSHLSEQGSNLAALVLFGAITGKDPQDYGTQEEYYASVAAVTVENYSTNH